MRQSPKTGNGFLDWGDRYFFPCHLLWLIFDWLLIAVLFHWVLINLSNDSVAQYLDSPEVAQVRGRQKIPLKEPSGPVSPRKEHDGSHKTLFVFQRLLFLKSERRVCVWSVVQVWQSEKDAKCCFAEFWPTSPKTFQQESVSILNVKEQKVTLQRQTISVHCC